MKKASLSMLSRLLRLVPILAVSVLVTTASAAVYNMMYFQAQQIGVEAAKVYFVTGADSTAAGATIGTNSTYVKFTSLSGWPNATRYYEDIAGIKNDDTSSRTIELKFDSWSGSTSSVSAMRVKVFNAGGVQQGSTVQVGTVDSTTGEISIPSSTTWRVQWEILWNAGALSSDKVDVTLTLKVVGE